MNIDLCDLRRIGPLRCGFEHLFNFGVRSCNQHFNTAVRPIAHPSVQPARFRLSDRPIAITHALNGPLDLEAENGGFTHVY